MMKLLGAVFVFGATLGCATEVEQQPAPGDPEKGDVFGEWTEVTECSGWELCLRNLVAGYDHADEEPSWVFPLRSDVGVVNSANVEISENCKDRIVVRPDNKDLVCEVAADKGIILGIASRTSMEENWSTINYEYTYHVKLMQNQGHPSRYRLDIE